MYNGQIIKYLLQANKLHNKELLSYLGYEGPGSSSAMKQLTEGNPTVKRLESVADFFKVSMDVFFNRSVEFKPASNHVVGNGNAVGTGNSVVTPQDNEHLQKIESLQRLIEEKDKRIETLELLVSVLKNNK